MVENSKYRCAEPSKRRHPPRPAMSPAGAWVHRTRIAVIHDMSRQNLPYVSKSDAGVAGRGRVLKKQQRTYDSDQQQQLQDEVCEPRHGGHGYSRVCSAFHAKVASG